MASKILLFCVAAALALPVVAAGKVEVRLLHRQSGAAEQALAGLAERFSAAEKAGTVVLEREDSAASGADAAQLLLADDDRLAAHMGQHRLRPLHQFLAENHVRIDERSFFPALRDAVDDSRGRLQALPLALALPVLYYNKQALRRAGLDPDHPPRTWWELQKAAGAVFDSGSACPYASSWPIWVHLENTSTQHNEPFLTGGRGATRLSFNSLVHVKHIALLSSWFKSRYFRLFGDADEADGRFAAGECALLTSASTLYGELDGKTAFEVGIADLPYYDDVYGVTPANVVVSGAALWAFPGRDRQANQVAARFVAYLLKPENQAEWVRATGYLPMTSQAGLKEIAGLGRPPAQLLGRAMAERRQLNELRLQSADGYRQLRSIIGEELSAVWARGVPAKQALDEAVRRASAAFGKSGASR